MRVGLGPVFAAEWLTMCRRWQIYAGRALFVLALLVALTFVWSHNVAGKTFPSLRAQADVGINFFLAIVGTQITLILLGAPAATAASICHDKATGTLAHVLITDLSDSEIVLGKLAARLLPAVALVVCTLPMTSLCTLLGGIDPVALFAAFLISLGLAVLGGAMALAFSVCARKTHEALMASYAVWGLWLLVVPVAGQINSSWINGALWLQKFDPYRLAFAPYVNPQTAEFGDAVMFLAGALVISAGLTVVSVLQLRPQYLRSLERRTIKIRPLPRLDSWIRRVVAALPGPSLDGNPVFWREWHRQRPSRLGRVIWAVYFGLAASFSVSAILAGATGPYCAWVNGLQVAIGLLLLSVSASTSLAEERVRGSLDVLMTTPLSTSTIVAGKWLGIFRLVPLLLVLPIIVAFASARGNPLLFGHVILLAGLIVSYGAAVTSLGLLTATWVRRLGRVVSLCTGTVLFMTVGFLFLVILLYARPGPVAERVAMGSPFMGAGEITWEMGQKEYDSLPWAVGWIIAYLGATVLMLAATLATFDRRLGRASSLAWGPRDPRFRVWVDEAGFSAKGLAHPFASSNARPDPLENAGTRAGAGVASG